MIALRCPSFGVGATFLIFLETAAAAEEAEEAAEEAAAAAAEAAEAAFWTVGGGGDGPELQNACGPSCHP